MGAGVVATGDKGGLGGSDALEGGREIGGGADVGGVVGGADDDKIVVHDVVAAEAVALGHKLVFSVAGMD